MSQSVQNVLACKNSTSQDFQTAVNAKDGRELSTFVQGQSGSATVTTIKIHLRLWNSILYHSCRLPNTASRTLYRVFHSEHRDNPPTRCASGSIVALPQGTPALPLAMFRGRCAVAVDARECNAPDPSTRPIGQSGTAGGTAASLEGAYPQGAARTHTVRLLQVQEVMLWPIHPMDMKV